MALAIKQNQKYTFADYESWPENERWEIIEGTPYAMTAPSRLHQKIILKLGLHHSNTLSFTWAALWNRATYGCLREE